MAALALLQGGEEPAERWVRSTDLPAHPPALALDDAQRAALVGDRTSPPLGLKVFVAGGKLMLQVPGQPAFEMFARSPRSLYLTAVDVQLEFDEAMPAATALRLTQGSARLQLKRR